MIELVESLGGVGADVHDLTTLAAMVLQFAGFLRSKEVLALQRDTIEFEHTHVRMFMHSSWRSTGLPSYQENVEIYLSI